MKEDFWLKGAEKVIYLLAPLIAAFSAFMVYAVIPFGPEVSMFGHHAALQLTDLPVGVLVVFACSSLGVYGIVLSGWASGSTYPLLGGLRSAAQMISYEVAMGLSMVAVVLWRAADGFTASASSIAGGLLTLLYPAALGGFAALMVAEPAGRTRIAVFILVTVFSDIGGYAAGVRFGRHPMAPSLSPKKSWEGFAGSVLACGVVGALAVWLLLDGAWWGGAVLGVLVAGCVISDFASPRLLEISMTSTASSIL